MNNITLKAIGEEDFLKNHFLIPSYQRGYRWTEREVTDLLNDILEFQNKRNKEEGEFYCLQPIVVINKNGNWEVIDGQQRLTTLFIILTYLGEAKKYLFPNSQLYSIEYETREKDGNSSKEFLNQLKNSTEIDKTNSDFYHMSQAFLTVKTWFEQSGVNVGDFLNTLLKTNFHEGIDIANNIRFIWYEVVEEKNPIEIFTRLNMGKIPLTNAELVKALFFVTDKDESNKKRHQLQMGYEWDQIENALQNKNFWYFITSQPYKGSNHIELIFDLIAQKYVHLTSIDAKYKNDKLYTFYIFNNLIAQKLVPEGKSNTTESVKKQLWDEIKTSYRQFLDFYHHNEYYHLIGYLIHSSERNNISDIISLADNETKTEFEAALRKKIKSQFTFELSELSYDNYNETHRALFLFNVISTMKSNYNRFPFEKFKEENWSLEHIHAQNSEGLTKEQKRLLLEEQKTYFEKKNTVIFDRIVQLLEKSTLNDPEFNALEDEIFLKYSDKSKEHSIQNMALLSKDDNSALNNNIFPIKKDKIKQLDEKGSFIPMGTKNVFMKYYSKNVEQNVSWNTEDQRAYYNELEKTLHDYLPQIITNEN
ncbi:DUF262 domain-containing protein [Flavobacterium sp. ov086]|uniref:DUF262 domain-containing protein n=1 Tax=Flavobacterium sp. ov086 TaxID=1761785 RepID=UPI000B7615B9|nr:DUF262 domain-containing protein [Flavobacterium sp. ov086]SNR33126.1 Protein of unknown function DUF262 [Flavobacterium sp. ov086]